MDRKQTENSRGRCECYAQYPSHNPATGSCPCLGMMRQSFVLLEIPCQKVVSLTASSRPRTSYFSRSWPEAISEFTLLRIRLSDCARLSARVSCTDPKRMFFVDASLAFVFLLSSTARNISPDNLRVNGYECRKSEAPTVRKRASKCRVEHTVGTHDTQENVHIDRQHSLAIDANVA